MRIPPFFFPSQNTPPDFRRVDSRDCYKVSKCLASQTKYMGDAYAKTNIGLADLKHLISNFSLFEPLYFTPQHLNRGGLFFLAVLPFRLSDFMHLKQLSPYQNVFLFYLYNMLIWPLQAALYLSPHPAQNVLPNQTLLLWMPSGQKYERKSF